MLFDGQGRALEGSLAQYPITLNTTPAGASQADPEQLFDLLGCCIDETLAQMGPLTSQIGGVASCTFVGNVCGLDDAGQVVIPLLTYADTRAASEVATLRTDMSEAEIYQRTGCRFHPSYLPAQLRWLARTQPAEFDRVTHWLSFGEFVAWRLFAERAVSSSVASWSGLLNRHTLTWDETLLAHLPIQAEHLSSLTDVSQAQYGLRSEFASRWPALKNIPWFPTIGDGAAANIGSGCVSEAQVALTIGTTSAMRVVIADRVPPVPDGLWCYRVDCRRSLLGGALSEGGSLLDWLRKTLQLEQPAELNEQLSKLSPDGHGLTILPFLAGERSPGWVGEARATIHGLTLDTTPVQILQAGLEAVAYRLTLVFERLNAEITDEPALIVSGGALRHWPAWTQIIADALGRPLLISDVAEASARGVALLALEALGEIDLEATTPEIVSEYKPHPAHYTPYRQALLRQQALYDILLK